MNDQTLITALSDSKINVEAQLLSDAQRFLSIIETISRTGLEESVPAEMMQMFTDEQWTELLFEMQSGTTLFRSDYDIAGLHQSWIETGTLVLPEQKGQYQWLLFQDHEGLIIRSLNLEEYRALEIAMSGGSFSEMVTVLWPDLETEKAHHNMTEMILIWLQDGLVIDAGVPLPEDAEFEQEPMAS